MLSSDMRTRLNSAKALQLHVNQTDDRRPVLEAEDALSKNIDEALDNLEDESWQQRMKICLNITAYLIDEKPEIASNFHRPLLTVFDSNTTELYYSCIHFVTQLAAINPPKFVQIEPAIRQMITLKDISKEIRNLVFTAYLHYVTNNGEPEKVSEAISPTLTAYKYLENSETEVSSRTKLTGFLMLMVQNGSNIDEPLKKVGIFERELREERNVTLVMNVLSLYLSSIEIFGTEYVRDSLDPIPEYLENEEQSLREGAAKILVSLMSQDDYSIDELDVDVQQIKNVLKNSENTSDDIERRIEKLRRSENPSDQGKNISEIEDKYLKQNPNIDFEDYVGMESLKREAKKKIIEPLEEPDLHEEFGVEIQRGFLFYGPPGTGKTYFAKSLAGEFDLSYVEIDAADISSKWVGKPATNIQDVFRVACENEPCIVFIDEIDAIATDRSESKQTKSERQMVNQLLQSISKINEDNRDVIVIAATNLIDDVDSALLRSGRLGSKIQFSRPGEETRVKIFRQNCKPDTSSIDDEWLQTATEGMVQSDLVQLANDASYNALERYKEQGSDKSIQKEDVEKALSRTS